MIQIPSSSSLGLRSSVCLSALSPWWKLHCWHFQSSLAFLPDLVFSVRLCPLYICFHSNNCACTRLTHRSGSPGDGIIGRARAFLTRYFQDLQHTELGNSRELCLCHMGTLPRNICKRWNHIRTRLVRQRYSVCFL